jgi:hypothetical protein
LLSGSGLVLILKDLTLPSAIVIGMTAVAQLLNLIENEIIPTEKAIEDLCSLRLMYYNHWNDLENLYQSVDKLAFDEAQAKFYELRKNAQKIEELDNKVNVKDISKIIVKARAKTMNYLKSHYNV